MNLYFLVEGKAESKLYPLWLRHLLPKLTRVRFPDAVQQNAYYLIGNFGYPNLLGKALINSYEDINAVGKYNYLVVCLDVDEVTAEERREEVLSVVQQNNVSSADTCELVIVPQCRCIETWLLGNRSVYSRQPTDPNLLQYTKFYNVAVHDPERMGKYKDFSTHAQFHKEYLVQMLREKHVRYTEVFPHPAGETHYVEALLQRVQDMPEQLVTLQHFFSFCQMVRQRMNTV